MVMRKELRRTIKTLLEEYPRTRDSDSSLVCNVWWQQLGSSRVIESMNATQLMEKIADGKVSSWDTITRIRRKLQEEIYTLRGEKWNARHDKQDDVVKELQEIAIDYSSPGKY